MNRFGRFLVLGGCLFLMGAGCQSSDLSSEQDNYLTNETEDSNIEQEQSMELSHPGILPEEQIQNKQVRITTEKGDIVFALFPDTAPLTVSNFVYLAEQGYYDGLIFHRVVEDFVIQGGDPTGTGRSGPGYRFEDELGPDHIPQDLQQRMDDHAEKALYQKGIVAMANAGPDTNGSQFFIMLEDIPSASMPNLYSIFGEVLEGQDVVDQIQVGDVMTSVKIEETSSDEETNN